MKLFFDTSALIKFFHKEDGSQKVTELIVSEENEIWISELARIEFISAVFRRFRNREMSETELSEALSAFEEELTSFNIEPLGHAIVKETETLIKRYGKTMGLRSLDALHLGTFSLISEDDWSFVAADKGLCDVAQALGYKAINPLFAD